MSEEPTSGGGDVEHTGSVTSYTAGLAFALLLTGLSFIVAKTNLLSSRSRSVS